MSADIWYSAQKWSYIMSLAIIDKDGHKGSPILHHNSITCGQKLTYVHYRRQGFSVDMSNERKHFSQLPYIITWNSTYLFQTGFRKPDFLIELDTFFTMKLNQ